MRSTHARAREHAAVGLAIILATLALVACHLAPDIGAARGLLLLSGCVGWVPALVLPPERSDERGAVSIVALLVALGSSIVLILVCAGPTGNGE